ncbi:MAG: hypothetical protein WCB99_08910 [Candidatus Cybelea sp.]
MAAVLTLADLDANVEQRESDEIEQRQRQVRIALPKTARHRVDLSWNTGGRFGRREPLYLNPGRSVVLPLDRASHFFGPFAWILELQTCTDEARRAALKYTIATESERVLKQYDYDRPMSKGKDGYEPIGPHRFPDVTVTILNADDTEETPMRLHEIYRKGEYDPLKDQLVPRATIEETEKRHKDELAEQEHDAKERIRALEMEAQKALGMVKGVVAVATGKA